MAEVECIFCNELERKENIFAENEFFFARWDQFPVSKGHAEIVIRWHTASIFNLVGMEYTKMFELLSEVKNIIQKKYNPDGYTIGINEGEAAGRTVHHLHLHIIPRYTGDVPNPRGGIRNVIPGKGDYK